MSGMVAFALLIKVMCFAASYAVAFGLELWHLARPRPILHYLALAFGVAGLFAHFVYLIVQAVPLGSPTGSLLVLAFVLAIFYVGEAIHHQRIAWALFVLPVVLVLIGLAVLVEGSADAPANWDNVWVVTHITLLLLAAVGVAIGFIASVMYLVQLRRLQAKLPPGQGLPLFSLERLELMNRRAILWSFPLLTAGLVIGVVLLISNGFSLEDWLTPRILSIAGLWLVFVILLYLRYRVHVRGKQLAWLTLVAFPIFVLALLFSHPFAQGGGQ